MFNVHTQRRGGWALMEQLSAIERLMNENGHMSHEELARELGMSLRTFKDRLDLLNMPDSAKRLVARGEIDAYVALRAGHARRHT